MDRIAPRRAALASGLACVLLIGCGSPDPAPETSAPSAPASQTASQTLAAPAPAESSAAPSAPRTAPDGRPFVVQEQAVLVDPWAMAFLPGTDYLAITERSGAMWLRDTETGEMLALSSGLPEVFVSGQAGLGDIMPAPDFETSSMVYLTWSESGEGGAGSAVGRATLVIDGSQPRLDGLEVIWRQTPKVDGSGHFSQRLAFSPDGDYLFVTSGDRQKMAPAQDMASTLGKVMRMRPDGSEAKIWTLGHRNPLGLAFAPDGTLWSTEMGPKGGDELNVIVEGANYGWPRASNGSHYDGADIPDHQAGDGYEAPKAWWNPSISPGNLMIYDGQMFGQWRGDAFIGALSGMALIRVDLDGTTATEADNWPMSQRIREVEQGPDGSIWLLEDAGSGRLLKLVAP